MGNVCGTLPKLGNLTQESLLKAKERTTRVTKDVELPLNPNADIRMFSGCADHQTSADAYDAGVYGGACTTALLDVIKRKEGRDVSWIDLLTLMREDLERKRYTQIPQLSSSSDVDLSSKFSILNPRSNGRFKALMIGINYPGTDAELNGCHNDVIKMTEYIKTQNPPGTEWVITTLMDDEDKKYARPNKANIVAGLQWLMEGVESGDTLFIHYSGHGGSIDDENGDEEDGKDECLCPMDYETAGVIVDDDVYNLVVGSCPGGVRMTVVMDCCHSGTIMDLPVNFVASEDNVQDFLAQMKKLAVAILDDEDDDGQRGMPGTKGTRNVKAPGAAPAGQGQFAQPTQMSMAPPMMGMPPMGMPMGMPPMGMPPMGMTMGMPGPMGGMPPMGMQPGFGGMGGMPPMGMGLPGMGMGMPMGMPMGYY